MSFGNPDITDSRDVNQTFETPSDKYCERKIVNGIEVSVAWVEHAQPQGGEYEISFPQMELTDEIRSKLEIHDQIIYVTKKREVAKQAFDHAVSYAEKHANVYAVYNSVMGFIFENGYAF